MSTAPASLVELGAYYESHGGVNLGIVGDSGHTMGYHLGRDRIYDGSGPGIGEQDYSVQHPRDKAGLTNAAAAIDFGRLEGSLERLYAFSRWLVAQCQAGAPGSRDVREVIYSPDGERVQRYSGIDGSIHTGPGNGDAGHLTHTHVSYFRDSQARSKIGLVAPYLEGDDMPTKQDQITNLTPMEIDVIPVGADILDLDGTKLYENHVVRLNVFSPCGRGSKAVGDEKWPRREWVLDPDGSGPEVRRTVLTAVDPDSLTPWEAPPAPTPVLHRYVITVDSNEIAVTQDGAPIP